MNWVKSIHLGVYLVVDPEGHAHLKLDKAANKSVPEEHRSSSGIYVEEEWGPIADFFGVEELIHRTIRAKLLGQR